jgi:hypothetical protein
MEPLHLMFKFAQTAGLLGSLPPVCDTVKVSLYADVAAILYGQL